MFDRFTAWLDKRVHLARFTLPCVALHQESYAAWILSIEVICLKTEQMSSAKAEIRMLWVPVIDCIVGVVHVSVMLLSSWRRGSIAMAKRIGDSGQPCLTPMVTGIPWGDVPLKLEYTMVFRNRFWMTLTIGVGIPT